MAGMNPYLPSYRRLCFVPVPFLFQHIYCFLENCIRRENERMTGLFDRNIRYDSLLINNPSGSRPIFSNGNFQCFPISIRINGLYRSLAIACLPDDDAFFLVLHRTGQNLSSTGAVPVYQDSHGHGVFNSFNGEIFTPLMPGMVAVAGHFMLTQWLFGQTVAIIYLGFQLIIAAWIVYELIRALVYDD